MEFLVMSCVTGLMEQPSIVNVVCLSTKGDRCDMMELCLTPCWDWLMAVSTYAVVSCPYPAFLIEGKLLLAQFPRNLTAKL